jgi:hypothetical protein
MFKGPDYTIYHQFKFLLGHVEDCSEMILDRGLQELEEVYSVVRVAIEILGNQRYR